MGVSLGGSFARRADFRSTGVNAELERERGSETFVSSRSGRHWPEDKSNEVAARAEGAEKEIRYSGYIFCEGISFSHRRSASPVSVLAAP